MEKRLKIEEIVWAKIRGFPWWPAVIGKIEESDCPTIETKIKVFFIGDPSHAEVSISKIEKFDKKYDEYSKTKKRSLLNSIVLAKKIIKGEITFNNHLISENNGIKKNIVKNPKSKVEEIQQEKTVKVDGTNNISNKMKGILNRKRNRKNSEGAKSAASEAELNNRRRRTRKIEVKSVSEESEDEEEKMGLEERLIKKIKELVFFKIELPSSTSNKSILSSLEEISSIIKEIKHDNLHEVIKDLMQFLICLTTNKNQTISIKASALSNAIQNKIRGEIFHFEGNNLPSDFCEEFFITSEYQEKDLNSLLELITKNQTETENLLLPKKRRRSRNFSKSILINNTKEINVTKNKENSSEESYLSEISLNSEKTDCEDCKITQKQRFIISPLEKSEVYAILNQYLSEFNFKDESHFNDNFTKGDMFSILHKNKTPIKNHYMRRRVCMKLFQVFYKLLKKMNIESEIIKNLSIYLELKARDGDPNMSDKYREFISSIFKRIKCKLLSPSTPIFNEVEVYS